MFFGVAGDFLGQLWGSLIALLPLPDGACHHIERCLCFDDMRARVENNSILDQDNTRLRDEVSTLITQAATFISQENTFRTAQARIQFCQTHHQNFRDTEEARQILITRVSDLERECNDLKRKYNRVANTNFDLHPLRMDQPGNLAEIVEDLRTENQDLRADLDTLSRVIPTPDLKTANREINQLRAEQARCQLDNDRLPEQIRDQSHLAIMTEDDQRVALSMQVDNLRYQIETKNYEVYALGIKVRQLQREVKHNDELVQRTRAELAAALDEMPKLRLATQNQGAMRSTRPRHQDDEVAYDTLLQLCSLLDKRLRSVAALPSISSIAGLVEMIPNDNQWPTAQAIFEFVNLAFDIVILVAKKEFTVPKQVAPPVDLDAVLPKEPILQLGQQLDYALVGYKSRTPPENLIIEAFEEMIRVNNQISKNDDGLRAQIKRLEKEIVDDRLQKDESLICLQWTSALRQLNEQAVAALSKIGFKEKPPPDFGAAEYIHDSVKYIQDLLNQIHTLEQGGQVNSEANLGSELTPDPADPGRRRVEWETYNELVTSFNELRYFLEGHHGNDARATKLGNKPRKELRSAGETVTLIEIHGLLQKVREMRDLIRDLGQEKKWYGSQLNWVAPQSGYEDAKLLTQALAYADDMIVYAQTLLDENGPNHAPEKRSSHAPPKSTSTAAPLRFYTVTEARIAVFLAIVLAFSCHGRLLRRGCY